MDAPMAASPSLNFKFSQVIPKPPFSGALKAAAHAL
jgi:hypothetical protein